MTKFFILSFLKPLPFSNYDIDSSKFVFPDPFLPYSPFKYPGSIVKDDKLLFSESSINELNNYWFNPIPIYDYLILIEILSLKDRYLMNEKLDLNRFNNWITRSGSHTIYVRQNLLKN